MGQLVKAKCQGIENNIGAPNNWRYLKSCALRSGTLGKFLWKV
jgi:hypothetical protein